MLNLLKRTEAGPANAQKIIQQNCSAPKLKNRPDYRERAGVCARGQALVESFPMSTQCPWDGGIARTGNGGCKTA